ncbi:hypothetical protein D779_1088 [Imhoffiella purpurea]|uniref:Uncharacterized protein n=2 Tax=Imhoffiella purpurea TaxID=1249627 RepID=W9VZ80_9GAMM|nr:hypothetical protein D779_1088 [Imhoffiella purpurea]
MANGFVLVLLREIRESIQKLRQECGDRLDQSSERLERATDSLGRVENDLNEQRKFTRQIALNQSKHEELHTGNMEQIQHELRELREEIRQLRQGR